MDPEEMAKNAVANLLKQKGLVADNIGQDNELAKRFRDQILEGVSEAEAFDPVKVERLLTIHAWNPQMGAMFYENNHMAIAYKMEAGAAWQLAGVQDITDAGVDPYDMEGFFPQAEEMGAVIQQPKLFVYVGKDGCDTAAV